MKNITQFQNENHHEEGNYKDSTFVWNDILQEVMKRKANGQNAGLFSDEEIQNTTCNKSRQKMLLKKKNLASYNLGAKYGNTFFTRREAECMVLLLRGKTTSKIATILELSPRTVADYIRNMKIKVNCRSIEELISLVRRSEFIKNIDF